MASSCCTGTTNYSELPDGKTMCAQGVETTEVDRIVEIETVQDVKDQFKIISKTSDHCIISGDGDFVENTLSRIEANLAGTMLLYECDSHVMRFVHWALWYGLSCNKVNGAYIGYDELDPVTGETVFWFYGLNKKIKIRQSVLERTWSGRLYIQDYRESRWMFLSYLRRDIDSRLKMVKLRFYRVN